MWWEKILITRASSQIWSVMESDCIICAWVSTGFDTTCVFSCSTLRLDMKKLCRPTIQASTIILVNPCCFPFGKLAMFSLSIAYLHILNLCYLSSVFSWILLVKCASEFWNEKPFCFGLLGMTDMRSVEMSGQVDLTFTQNWLHNSSFIRRCTLRSLEVEVRTLECIFFSNPYTVYNQFWTLGELMEICNFKFLLKTSLDEFIVSVNTTS